LALAVHDSLHPSLVRSGRQPHGEDDSRTVVTKEQFVVATTHPVASMAVLVHGEGESVRGGGGVSSG
jgi:hypothetical protein